MQRGCQDRMDCRSLIYKVDSKKFIDDELMVKPTRSSTSNTDTSFHTQSIQQRNFIKELGELDDPDKEFPLECQRETDPSESSHVMYETTLGESEDDKHEITARASNIATMKPRRWVSSSVMKQNMFISNGEVSRKRTPVNNELFSHCHIRKRAIKFSWKIAAKVMKPSHVRVKSAGSQSYQSQTTSAVLHKAASTCVADDIITGIFSGNNESPVEDNFRGPKSRPARNAGRESSEHNEPQDSKNMEFYHYRFPPSKHQCQIVVTQSVEPKT